MLTKKIPRIFHAKSDGISTLQIFMRTVYCVCNNTFYNNVNEDFSLKSQACL